MHFETDGRILDGPNGRQLGYLKDDVLFRGGNGDRGATEYPQPRRRVAAYFLLT